MSEFVLCSDRLSDLAEDVPCAVIVYLYLVKSQPGEVHRAGPVLNNLQLSTGF